MDLISANPLYSETNLGRTYLSNKASPPPPISTDISYQPSRKKLFKMLLYQLQQISG